jgi:hypothetical protein
METITIGFYVWSLALFILLMICPKERIPLITKFYEKVLPKLPITGIIRVIKEAASKKS